MWIVYEIKTEDGKIYIGCTNRSLDRRILEHKSRKMPFVSGNYTALVVAVSESKEIAHKIEHELILRFDSTNPEKGYNRRFGGSKYGFPDYVHIADNFGENTLGENNSMWGKKHSDETKEKIRQKALSRDPSTFAKNKIKTAEQLQKLWKGRDAALKSHGSCRKGKIHSDETKKKISEAMKGHKRWLGRKHSEESKTKIRESKALNKKIQHCNMQNCHGLYKAKGYCQKHYRQLQRHGKVTL